MLGLCDHVRRLYHCLFKVNDIVFLRDHTIPTPGVTTLLRQNAIGPFKVVEKQSKKTLAIQSLINSKVYFTKPTDLRKLNLSEYIMLLDDNRIAMGKVNSRFPRPATLPDQFPITDNILQHFYEQLISDNQDTPSDTDTTQVPMDNTIIEELSDVLDTPASSNPPAPPGANEDELGSDIDFMPTQPATPDSPQLTDLDMPLGPTPQPPKLTKEGEGKLPVKKPTLTREVSLRRNPKKKVIFDL